MYFVVIGRSRATFRLFPPCGNTSDRAGNEALGF